MLKGARHSYFMPQLPRAEGFVFSSAVFMRLCLLWDRLLVCDESLNSGAHASSCSSSHFFCISPTSCNCNSYKTLVRYTDTLHAFQV